MNLAIGGFLLGLPVGAGCMLFYFPLSAWWHKRQIKRYIIDWKETTYDYD